MAGRGPASAVTVLQKLVKACRNLACAVSIPYRLVMSRKRSASILSAEHPANASDGWLRSCKRAVRVAQYFEIAFRKGSGSAKVQWISVALKKYGSCGFRTKLGKHVHITCQITERDFP